MYLLILDQMHNSAVTLKKLLWLNKDAFNKGESYLVSVELYEKKKMNMIQLKGRYKSLKKIMPVIFMLTVFYVEVCKTTQYKF